MIPNNEGQEKTVWVVGDIHGCYDEFLRLEKRIQRQAQKQNSQALIVSVGDLVDRGPNSSAVVEHFRAGEAQGTHKAIAGNHESMMLLSLQANAPWNFENAGVVPPLWLDTVHKQIERGVRLSHLATEAELIIFKKLMWVFQGGSETLESYNCDPRDPQTWHIPPQHMQYLTSLPLYWENEHAIVTHALAGHEEINALQQNQDQNPQSTQLELAHSVLWARQKPQSTPHEAKIHISGHSVFSRIQRDRKLNIIQIDTGCTFEGRLTAWCPASQKSMSVGSDVSWSYY